MPKRKNYTKVIIAVAVVAGVLMTASFVLSKRHDIERSLERASLPEAKEYSDVIAETPEATSKSPKSTPTNSPSYQGGDNRGGEMEEINLAVPFTPQAPFANWEPPYKEFCEEASVLMAAKYLQGEDIPSAEVADRDMLAIKVFEEKRFGYYEDTTAAETAVILKEYFDIDAVKLLENPTVEDIKQAIGNGKLVIVPAAGRLLGNPYYTPPGPLYHMFVIKGYTANGKFITNDPGTRRGADFLFSEDAVMNAMHDWRADGEVTKGKKVVIVIG